MSKSLPSILAELLGYGALRVASMAEPLHHQLAGDPDLKDKAKNAHGMEDVFSSFCQSNVRLVPVQVELQEGLNHLAYF